MYSEATYRIDERGARNVRSQSSNVPAASSNDAYKSLISLPAAIFPYVVPQRPAKSSKVLCFQCCSVQQHPSRNMHPYGGRAGKTPPDGSGLFPRGLGVESKAELKADRQHAGTVGLPYRRISVRVP